nr:hypothetical protein CFP56_76424 [Quercus suber]
MTMSSLLFLPLPKPDSHCSETQPRRLDSVDEEEEQVVGPPRPSPALSFGDSDSEEEEKWNQYRIPLSNEIVLKGHTKNVRVLDYMTELDKIKINVLEFFL